MYYMTGLPGWVRFGFSPGWRGRGQGNLPVGAQYLMQSGQVPQFMSYIQRQQISYPQLTKESELNILESQAKFLEQQLEQVKKKIEELKK